MPGVVILQHLQVRTIVRHGLKCKERSFVSQAPVNLSLHSPPKPPNRLLTGPVSTHPKNNQPSVFKRKTYCFVIDKA